MNTARLVRHLSTAPKPIEFDVSQAIDKVRKLPLKINTNLLDVNTLQRIDKSSIEFLRELVLNLDQYGIKERNLIATLKTHENWSHLTKTRLDEFTNTFRALSFKPELYTTLFAHHPDLLTAPQSSLVHRLNQLRLYFTRDHLERLLPRSPHILTSSFDSFRYKFSYVLLLMGFEQRQMCSTRVFNYTIEFIRERHLFIERSLFFDKPNKKRVSRLENPKLAHIVDSNLTDYLRLCTRGLMTEDDYRVFCDYLAEEKFDNELLASWIDKALKNQILENIRVEKSENYEF